MPYNTPNSSLALLTDPALEVDDKFPCARCDQVNHADDMHFDDLGDFVCCDCEES